MGIKVHYQNVKFQLTGSTEIKKWIMDVILQEGMSPGEIHYIFVEDKSQKEINKEFLEHDYNTDVITFDYSVNNIVSGEIYIAVETVKRNAGLYHSSFRREYLRVMLHGVLHLLGYKDKNERDIELMRKKEKFYLEIF